MSPHSHNIKIMAAALLKLFFSNIIGTVEIWTSLFSHLYSIKVRLKRRRVKATTEMAVVKNSDNTEVVHHYDEEPSSQDTTGVSASVNTPQTPFLWVCPLLGESFILSDPPFWILLLLYTQIYIGTHQLKSLLARPQCLKIAILKANVHFLAHKFRI